VNSSKEEAIRNYYRAYETGARDVVEQLLSDDFTFTSPHDDRIDRTTYFAKCWPGHQHLRQFALRQVLVDGDQALVRYQAVPTDRPSFHNVEHFEFHDGQVRHIDVYFGAIDDIAPTELT
jgi:ketosteroid isomerase-like protein